MSKTLQGSIDHLNTIFGRRNVKHLPTLGLTLSFLTRGINNLERRFEYGDVAEYSNKLASLFARWCAVIHALPSDLPDLQIVPQLALKYGAACSYCAQTPCSCPEGEHGRSRPVVSDNRHAAWTLRDWQHHLENVYADKNKRNKDFFFVVRRLYSEASECTGCWLMATRPLASSQRDDRHEYYYELLRELSDVFAWIMGAANFLNIDLETAVHNEYRHGCKKCNRFACVCVEIDPTRMSFRS